MGKQRNSQGDLQKNPPERIKNWFLGNYCYLMCEDLEVVRQHERKIGKMVKRCKEKTISLSCKNFKQLVRKYICTLSEEEFEKRYKNRWRTDCPICIKLGIAKPKIK